MIHKNLFRFFCLCFAAAQLSGCATNYYVERKPASVEITQKPLEVYVTNPDHYGFNTLRDSHIYTLIDNPNAPNRLTLENFQFRITGNACGLGILSSLYISIYTLGLLPVSGHNTYDLSYKLESNGISKLYKHEINYSHTSSTWEILFVPFAYSEEEAQAKTLSRSDRVACEDPTCGITSLLNTE